MATNVDIANMALGEIGTRATIANLTENSVEAREINRVYVTLRDALQQSMDWNFNRVYQTLASSGTPPSRWIYSYAYPSDCLKFWRIDMGVSVWALDPAALFEVGSDGTSQFIWTNVTEAVGVFGQRVTDPNRWDPAFTFAFVAALAAKTCLPITQKDDRVAGLRAHAKDMVELAQRSAVNEGVSAERDRVSESLSIRGFDYADPAVWPWIVR